MLIPIKDDNPTRTFPILTITLIAINTGVFIYMLGFTSSAELMTFFNTYAMIPKAIVTGAPVTATSLEPVYLTIISSMFLHGGLLHIAFNMLYLWIFGNNIEDTFGGFKYLLTYFFAGIGGALAQIAIDPSSTIPNIGASGAVSGILAAYLILFPQARVLTVFPVFFFIPLIRVPAIVMIGLWIVLQLFSGAASIGQSGAGVAYFAHIGGFVVGLVLTLLISGSRPRRASSPYDSYRSERSDEDWYRRLDDDD